MEGYWLPEHYALHLNALEIGWLTAMIVGNRSDMRVNKPGPDGEPLASTMREELLEKLLAAANFGAEESRKGAAGHRQKQSESPITSAPERTGTGE